MTPDTVEAWMLAQVERDGCIYQDDVVDYLVRAKREDLLVENADGNQDIGKVVLAAFLKLTATTVVWVKPDRYWRWRVAEDEPGREARGCPFTNRLQVGAWACCSHALCKVLA